MHDVGPAEPESLIDTIQTAILITNQGPTCPVVLKLVTYNTFSTSTLITKSTLKRFKTLVTYCEVYDVSLNDT